MKAQLHDAVLHPYRNHARCLMAVDCIWAVQGGNPVQSCMWKATLSLTITHIWKNSEITKNVCILLEGAEGSVLLTMDWDKRVTDKTLLHEKFAQNTELCTWQGLNIFHRVLNDHLPGECHKSTTKSSCALTREGNTSQHVIFKKLIISVSFLSLQFCHVVFQSNLHLQNI